MAYLDGEDCVDSSPVMVNYVRPTKLHFKIAQKILRFMDEYNIKTSDIKITKNKSRTMGHLPQNTQQFFKHNEILSKSGYTFVNRMDGNGKYRVALWNKGKYHDDFIEFIKRL